ncbi:MAG: DNA adenine methylase [Pseudomonadota bacterium]
MSVRRPALRYHGGKWLLAPWIVSHFPAHRIYVEPFAGAASVLLRKPRSYAEVYNDLDDDVVGLFRVLQDSALAERLIDKLRMTPFARREFDLAYEATDCPVERARRLLIRSFMGFGSDGHNGARKTGFRANSNRSGTTPAGDWANLPDAHVKLTKRLQGVVIENRDAQACMAQHDGPETLFYVDPPYVHETRAPSRTSERKAYRHEMTDDDHEALLAFLKTLEGKVILSGYRCDLYDDHLEGWTRMDRAALADGARQRIESLWMNAAAQENDLFEWGAA